MNKETLREKALSLKALGFHLLAKAMDFVSKEKEALKVQGLKNYMLQPWRIVVTSAVALLTFFVLIDGGGQVDPNSPEGIEKRRKNEDKKIKADIKKWTRCPSGCDLIEWAKGEWNFAYFEIQITDYHSSRVFTKFPIEALVCDDFDYSNSTVRVCVKNDGALKDSDGICQLETKEERKPFLREIERLEVLRSDANIKQKAAKIFKKLKRADELKAKLEKMQLTAQDEVASKSSEDDFHFIKSVIGLLRELNEMDSECDDLLGYHIQDEPTRENRRRPRRRQISSHINYEPTLENRLVIRVNKLKAEINEINKSLRKPAREIITSKDGKLLTEWRSLQSKAKKRLCSSELIKNGSSFESIMDYISSVSNEFSVVRSLVRDCYSFGLLTRNEYPQSTSTMDQIRSAIKFTTTLYSPNLTEESCQKYLGKSLKSVLAEVGECDIPEDIYTGEEGKSYNTANEVLKQIGKPSVRLYKEIFSGTAFGAAWLSYNPDDGRPALEINKNVTLELAGKWNSRHSMSKYYSPIIGAYIKYPEKMKVTLFEIKDALNTSHKNVHFYKGSSVYKGIVVSSNQVNSLCNFLNADTNEPRYHQANLKRVFSEKVMEQFVEDEFKNLRQLICAMPTIISTEHSMPNAFTEEKNCSVNEIDGRYMIDDVVMTHGISAQDLNGVLCNKHWLGGIMPIVFSGDDIVGKIDVYVQFSYEPNKSERENISKLATEQLASIALGAALFGISNPEKLVDMRSVIYKAFKEHKGEISIEYKPLSWLIYDKKMFKEKVDLLCYERDKEDKAKQDAKAEAQKSALGL